MAAGHRPLTSVHNSVRARAAHACVYGQAVSPATGDVEQVVGASAQAVEVRYHSHRGATPHFRTAQGDLGQLREEAPPLSHSDFGPHTSMKRSGRSTYERPRFRQRKGHRSRQPVTSELPAHPHLHGIELITQSFDAECQPLQGLQDAHVRVIIVVHHQLEDRQRQKPQLDDDPRPLLLRQLHPCQRGDVSSVTKTGDRFFQKKSFARIEL